MIFCKKGVGGVYIFDPALQRRREHIGIDWLLGGSRDEANDRARFIEINKQK